MTTTASTKITNRKHDETKEGAIKQFIAWAENQLEECQGLDIFEFSKQAYPKLRDIVLKYEVVTTNYENLKEFAYCPKANKREIINKKQKDATKAYKADPDGEEFRKLVRIERDYWHKVFKALKKLLKSEKNKK
jgi:hypothetical protein